MPARVIARSWLVGDHRAMLFISPDVLAIAETLNLCLPPPPDQVRVIDPRFAAFIGKQDGAPHNLVQRLRLGASEIASVVDEVRAIFRSHGKRVISWEVGPSSTPLDLAAHLLALGMVWDEDPEVAGMVLTKPMSAPATRVTVRRVESFEDFCSHARILHACFGRGSPAPSDEDLRADHDRRLGREASLARYIALDGDQPIAAADAVFSDHAVALCGGATLPEHRGKGAYRALVDARFRDAEARGTPALVVQAGRMSRPILESMGFREVARVHVLIDELE